MTAPSAGPEMIAEFVLNLDTGRIVAEVIRVADGAVRLRLSHGEGVGDILTIANVCALRLMLTRTLEAMAAAEGRAA